MYELVEVYSLDGLNELKNALLQLQHTAPAWKHWLFPMFLGTVFKGLIFVLHFLKCSVVQDVECSSNEVSCQGRLDRVSLWILYGDEFVSGCFVFVNQTRLLLLNIISWEIVDTACV